METYENLDSIICIICYLTFLFSPLFFSITTSMKLDFSSSVFAHVVSSVH